MIIPDVNKLAAIKLEFEGFENKAYPDSGKVWTLGFGSTFNYDKNRPVREGDTISRVDALKWLETDNAHVITYLNFYIKQPLNPDQAAAIVDYIYNRGIGNFIKTNLDELINSDPLDEKIKVEIIGTGITDRLGHLLWGLGRRRRSQAYLYFTGNLKYDWPRWGATF